MISKKMKKKSGDSPNKKSIRIEEKACDETTMKASKAVNVCALSKLEIDKRTIKQKKSRRQKKKRKNN